MCIRMFAVYISVILQSMSALAAIESRMGINAHDVPRAIAAGPFNGSQINMDLEVIIPFHRLLIGMAFENYALNGKTDTSEVAISLNYKRTAALIGYRFAMGQYGPVDVTNDLLFTYGIVTDTNYVEKSTVGGTTISETTFSSDPFAAPSIYYLGTYGYGALIWGLKVGYQSTLLKNLSTNDGQRRPTLNLSSPFMGLSLGLFF